MPGLGAGAPGRALRSGLDLCLGRKVPARTMRYVHFSGALMDDEIAALDLAG